MPIADLLPPDATADDIAAVLAAMSDAEAAAVLYDWRGCWARAEQLPPDGGAWRTWLILAGRGFGKTRTGAETMREWTEADPTGVYALIGPTAADCRDVMIEGESGLMHVFPADRRPLYQSSKRRVLFRSGAIAYVYSAEEPATVARSAT